MLRFAQPDGKQTRKPVQPVRLKVLFAAVTVALVLAALEAAGRVAARVLPNERWAHHEQLVETIGFGELNRILEPDAELFWRVRANLKGVEIRGRIEQFAGLHFNVSTDGEGRRVMPAAPTGSPTVVFLGDSCTFGVCVEDGETIPAQVQVRLVARCINAGVPGYTAHQGLRLLEREIGRWRPAVVVISFGFNDRGYWDEYGDAEVEARLRAEQARWENRLYAVRLLRRLLPKRGADRSAPPSALEPGKQRRARLTDEEYEARLREMIDLCRRERAQPLLMVWPESVQLGDPRQFPKQVAMRRVAKETGTEIVDLVPLFRERSDTSLFADGLHASAAGCTAIADAVAPAIEAALGRKGHPVK